MNSVIVMRSRTDSTAPSLSTEFLAYLSEGRSPDGDRLPAIQDLARELGISAGKLREQLEVARQLGLVEVRPKTGIRKLPFSFLSTLRVSLRYAMSEDSSFFEQFGELRNRLELAYWREAVGLLKPEDRQQLRSLVERAWEKLRGSPAQIPHAEHRALHLTMYSRLPNTFVYGILEAYWEAYEAVGLNVYEDYAYLENVWNNHERMVSAILAGDIAAGYAVELEHAGLLHERPELDRIRTPASLSAEG
jgi:DNA-binding FadR family transcriptional regulator